MNEANSIKKETIESKIYAIRGMQVMLDKDLAAFYEVKPIRLREQVNRNLNRFPADFMFQLNDEEVDSMVSHNAIPSRQYLGGTLPYVFTEQGVGAISAVLTSERAVEVGIEIMRAFVAMRRFILTNAQIFQRLDSLEIKQLETDKKLSKVLHAIESKDIHPKQGIFFDGQVFDAYVFVADLIKSARKSIILIDNYVDESVLILFAKRKKGVKLTILTKTISDKLALDVKKFQEQYALVALKSFDKSHDRFLIIDEKTVYHFGASLKDLGKKWFAFSKMDISVFEILKEIGRLV
jgi:hypothetical protein